jgi:hypothetical protein
MGISSDIMHDFVAKEIRAIYSSYDGWKTTTQKVGSAYDSIVTLERHNNGHRECVRILVTYERTISPDLLVELQKPEKSCDGTLTRSSFAVMTPGNADISAVPAGMHLHSRERNWPG